MPVGALRCTLGQTSNLDGLDRWRGYHPRRLIPVALLITNLVKPQVNYNLCAAVTEVEPQLLWLREDGVPELGAL